MIVLAKPKMRQSKRTESSISKILRNKFKWEDKNTHFVTLIVITDSGKQHHSY